MQTIMAGKVGEQEAKQLQGFGYVVVPLPNAPYLYRCFKFVKKGFEAVSGEEK